MILFDYTLPGTLPGNSESVWSNRAIQPVAAGPLTPFSFTVLEEIIRRAWDTYYDRLGFAPPVRANVLRAYQGRAYLNLSITAKLEAQQAGVAPIILRVNGTPWPLAPWEKPGLLGGFKFARAQKKIDEQLAQLASQIEATTQQAQIWHIKTREAHWNQAEILQVMEEIERAGRDSMMAFWAARHQLTNLYARLLAAGAEGHDPQQTLLLLNSALADLTGLVESEMAAAIIDIAEQVQNPDAAIAWLKAGDYQNWRTEFPSRPAAEALADFFLRFGHRAMGEGELANPRWNEDPTMVMRSLLACIEYHPRRPAKMPAVNYAQKALETLQPAARKEGRQMLERLHEMHTLQSRALHALAFILAGTRRWALAAAQEAMSDGRLRSPDEIFFFELEEIKLMMTGEWNISAQEEIRATLAQRQAQHTAHQTGYPSDMLIGEQEAQPVRQGLPGVAGHAGGPLRRWTATRKNGCHHTIMGAEMLDSGWALGLPLADGFVAALGSPLDPLVAAARAWHHPVVVGLGDAYRSMIDGAQTTLDGDSATASQ